MTDQFSKYPVVEEETPQPVEEAGTAFSSYPEVSPGKEDTEADSAVGTFFSELLGPTLLGGVRDALEATIDLAMIGDELPQGGLTVDDLMFKFGMSREEAQKKRASGELRQPDEPVLPQVPEPSTLGGSMVRDLTQFMTGFVPMFAATGGVGGVAALGGFARGAIAGGVADFVVFDGQEERLANLVAEYPIIGALAANPDDPEILGRFKNMVEGAILGGAADIFIRGVQGAVRSLRGAKATKAISKGDPDVQASGNAATDAPAPPSELESIEVQISEKKAQIGRFQDAGKSGTKATKDLIRLNDQKEALLKTQAAEAPPAQALNDEDAAAAGLQPADLFTQLDPDIQIRAAGRTSLFPTREVRVAGNINLDRIDSPEALKNAVDVIARSQGGFEGARAAGREAGEEYTRAQRRLLNDSTANLMVEAAATNGSSVEGKLRFMARLAQHTAIQKAAAGAAAEASARLRTYKEIMSLSPQNIDDLKSAIDQLGGEELAEQKALLLSQLDDMAGFNKAAESAWKPTKLDKFLEFWRAGLLTGFRTHEANLGSNTLVTAYSVPERLVGAAWGALSKGEKIKWQESVAFANGARKAWKKGASDAWQVFWREGADDTIPDVVKSRVPVLREGQLPGGLESKFDLSAQKKAIEGDFGYWVRTPFRALNAMDVMAKTVNFAGEAEALATRQALDRGLSGGDLKEEVVRLLTIMPDDIANPANAKASANTFTTNLREQTGLISDLAQSMSKFTAKHPSFGFIAPFIKTPANILKFAGERTPAAFVMKDWKKLYNSGAIGRQEALAKMSLGTAIMGTAAGFAADGVLTGNGPIQPAKRRIWRQAGNQPYSVLINGTWYSYARFEPLATLLGIAADGVEIGTELVDQGEWDQLSLLMVMAFANTTTSKTFMQGPVGLIEAINDPRRFGDRFVQMLIGSTVPTLAADVARAVDPTLRDTRGFADAWLNRVAGASGLVEPLLNLWGEDVVREGGRMAQVFSPIYVTKAGKDKLSQEMLDMDYSPSMPGRQINGHDLTAKQYTEYVRLAGKDAKRVLTNIVEGPGWKTMSVWVKTQVFEQVITQFRNLGKGLMLANHPELVIPKRLEEELGIGPQADVGGDDTPEDISPEQANILAANAGVPLPGDSKKKGRAPSVASLEKKIDDAGRKMAKAAGITVPEIRPVDGEAMIVLVADPDRMQEAFFNDPGNLPAEQQSAMSARFEMAQRASDYLRSHIPQSPDPLGVFHEAPSIPQHEKETWERRVVATINPFTVVEDISNGAVSDVAISALRAVHPAVFERLRASVVSALVDEKEPVSYERRMVMAELLGPEIEPTLNPRFIASIQNTFATPQPAQTPVPQRQNLSPSEERDKSKNISTAMADRLSGGETLSTPIQEVAEA